MRLEKNKTGRAKNPKVGVRGTGAMQTLIRSVIMNDRRRDTIYSVSSSESCLSPKCSGQEEDRRRARVVSRIWRCFRSARPFC
ncbi:hypothetical protein CsSME_00005623 [Camellia sinensis var. sinensis]